MPGLYVTDYLSARQAEEIEKKIIIKKKERAKDKLIKFKKIASEIKTTNDKLYNELCNLGKVGEIDKLERNLILLKKKLPTLERFLLDGAVIREIIKSKICPYCNGSVTVKHLSHGRRAEESSENTFCEDCGKNFGKGNLIS